MAGDGALPATAEGTRRPASTLRSPERLIDDLAARNSDALALAVLVCIASRIEPELLRAVRLRMLTTADASAEADLWLSPLMRTRGALFAVMRTDVAGLLRERLRADPDRLKEAVRIVADVHGDTPPALLLEEEITWRSLADPADPEIAQRFASVSAALNDRGRMGLARWAARALPELPAAARDSPAAWDVNLKASTLMGFALAGSGVPLAAGPGSAHVPPPTDLPKVEIGLRLFSDSLRVSHPPEPDARTLSVPATSPLLLLVEWQQAGRAERRVVSFFPRSSQVVRGVETTGLSVTTAASDSFLLRLAGEREATFYRVTAKKGELAVCAYLGDRTVLLAFDVPRSATKDLLGFAVSCSVAGGPVYWLSNALSFGPSPSPPTSPSNEAPFQRFRWIHSRMGGEDGPRQYRISAMYGRPGALEPRQEVTLNVGLPSPLSIVQVGFTHPFRANQAEPQSAPQLRPVDLKKDRTEPLDTFDTGRFQDTYRSLGGTAHELMLGFIDGCLLDETSEAHVLAFDIDHPDIIQRFRSLGKRLTILLDDSELHAKQSIGSRLSEAGCQVIRFHFRRYSHSKCIIRLVAGKPVAVLTGSANFSIASLYEQSNHVIAIHQASVAEAYENYFEYAIRRPKAELPLRMMDVRPEASGIQVLFMPSKAPIAPLLQAIESAKSSILFCLGTEAAADIEKAIRARRAAGLLVEGVFLGDKTTVYSENIETAGSQSRPSPGQGKFVVIDFNDSRARVFAGSSNFSIGSAIRSGDNVVVMEGPEIATQFAIQAFSMVDRFRLRAAASRATARPLSLAPDDRWLSRFFEIRTTHYLERRLLMSAAGFDEEAPVERSTSMRPTGKSKAPAKKRTAKTKTAKTKTAKTISVAKKATKPAPRSSSRKPPVKKKK